MLNGTPHRSPRRRCGKLLERRDGPAVRDTLIWFGLLLAFGVAGLMLWGSGWAVIPFALYGVIYASTSDSRGMKRGTAPRSRPTG